MNLDFKLWGRQILAVVAGVACSFLLSFLDGKLLLRLAAPPQFKFVRLIGFLSIPALTLIAGICVGALAKSRPGTLAALSLAPLVLTAVPSTNDLLWALTAMHSQFLISMLLVFLSLLVGSGAAIATFRARTRILGTVSGQV